VTTATKITIVRFFLVPPLAAAIGAAVWWPERAGLMRVVALALFAAAVLTDVLDGYAARRLDQRSRLGAALDPLADKLLLGAAIWAMWACRGVYGPVPLWYPVLVSANDAGLGAGYLAVRRRIDPDELRAMPWGKAAAAVQMVAVLWLLLKAPHALVLVVTATACTLASGAAYVLRAVRLVGKMDLQPEDS
jgi:cardiolipin synthase